MKNIVTVDGDVLDKLVSQRYGKTAGVVEQVLAANPHLAFSELTAVLNRGVVIVLPDIESDTNTTDNTVQLWD